jgi:hypothetical protein
MVVHAIAEEEGPRERERLARPGDGEAEGAVAEVLAVEARAAVPADPAASSRPAAVQPGAPGPPSGGAGGGPVADDRPREHPSPARRAVAPPTLSEVRAWVAHPLIEPARTEADPVVSPSSPLASAAIEKPERDTLLAPALPEDHVLEIGTIQVTFEEAPVTAPAPLPLARRSPPASSPGPRLSRHYLR